MDYCEAVEILEELNDILKFIPYGSKEWKTTIGRMAKLQLFIQDYEKWADEQAAKVGLYVSTRKRCSKCINVVHVVAIANLMSLVVTSVTHV